MAQLKSKHKTWSRALLLAATLFLIHSYCYYAARILRPGAGEITTDAGLWQRSLVETLSDSKHRGKIVESPSWIHYLDSYNGITTTGGRVAFTIGLVAWLLFLFAFIGIVASDFFCPNLQVISSKMGLSESVVGTFGLLMFAENFQKAGSTILAFGNGSPDVFSTFASLSAGSGSLAIGELLGAAAFIVSVVAGIMTLVRPFKVARHSFMRDVGFFTVAVFFVLLILWDKHITQFEAGAMVVLYVFYVIAVVLGSWWHNRKERKAELLDKARTEYVAGDLPGAISDTEAQPNEHTALGGRRKSVHLYSAISPEYTPNASPHTLRARHRLETPIDDEILLDYAERSMPVIISRPRTHGRSRSSSSAINRLPINRSSVRPSLLGAIEFRDVVNSFSEDSGARTRTLGREGDSAPPSPINRPILDRTRSEVPNRTTNPLPPVHGRARSVTGSEAADDNVWSSTSDTFGQSRKADLIDLSAGVDDPWRGASPTQHLAPMQPRQALKIRIPEDSPTQPKLRKVPSIVLVAAGGQVTPIVPSSPEEVSPAVKSAEKQKSERWRSICSMAAAFFPSLTDLNEKSIVGMVAAILSAPALFLLILTLPVVDDEGEQTLLELDANSGDDVLANNVLGLNGAQGQDEEPGWRSRARHRDEHIAHILHSPAAMHHPHHDVFSSPLDVGSVDRGLSLFDQDAVHAHGTADFQQTGGVSPPATPEDDLAQTQIDERVYAFQTILQCLLCPFFCLLALMGDSLRWWYFLIALGASLLLSFIASTIIKVQRGRVFLCFVGFAVSMVWLLSIVNEIIGVLQAVGHVFGLSDAILGVTVFALGNSTADLVADWTIARMGYPVMAISACYGGPLLNLLLGVGASGSYFIAKSGQPYFIDFDLTLVTTCIGLLIILVATLLFIPYNNYVMSRSWGICELLSESGPD